MGNMGMNTAHVVWQAITPIHVGTGQDGSGIIDLPVAREASTGYPTLPASGLKGVIKDAHGASGGAMGPTLFGTVDVAGDLVFHDARLLALPVPSLWGTFALVTCPLVLRRLERDLDLQGFSTDSLDVPELAADRGAVPEGSWVGRDGQVLIDDFILEVEERTMAGLVGFLGKGSPEVEDALKVRLCVVPDDVFSFLVRYRLPISPHVRISEETGTVERGALWYEEVIPEETLLTSFVAGSKTPASDALQGMSVIQVGGHRTVGRGLVRLYVRESGGGQ